MMKLTPALAPDFDPDFEVDPNLTEAYIISLFSDVWENAGTDAYSSHVNVAYCRDEMGNEYRDLQAAIVGRLLIGSERFLLTSAGFAVSLDGLQNTLVEGLDARS